MGIRCPKPTEGSAKHCWGKRRRVAKKTEKGIWKALVRIGVITNKRHRGSLIVRAKDCYWSEDDGWFHPYSKLNVPMVFVDQGMDYWGESEECRLKDYAGDYLDQKMNIWSECSEDTGWPTRRSHNGSRHALKLLREEIKMRKEAADPSL